MTPTLPNPAPGMPTAGLFPTLPHPAEPCPRHGCETTLPPAAPYRQGQGRHGARQHPSVPPSRGRVINTPNTTR